MGGLSIRRVGRRCRVRLRLVRLYVVGDGERGWRVPCSGGGGLCLWEVDDWLVYVWCCVCVSCVVVEVAWRLSQVVRWRSECLMIRGQREERREHFVFLMKR